MILRSSLLRRREDVSTAEFSRHFREVQGPLAARLPKTRAYKQNHRVRRWDLPEATLLPRVDAYSQIWFDDLHTMYESMDSPEQAIAYEDFAAISDSHTVTVQDPGQVLGSKDHGPTKLTLVLVGDPARSASAEEDLNNFLERAAPQDYSLRVNSIVVTGDSTPIKPSLGAFAEIWLPDDSRAQNLMNEGLLVRTGLLTICTAMLVEEFVLVEGPEF
jgi:uncharacterized protein (TIGR02118 family)